MQLRHLGVAVLLAGTALLVEVSASFSTASRFHAAICVGCSSCLVASSATVAWPLIASSAFVGATKAEIRTGGNQPMYAPTHDFIAMPALGQFRNANNFYATLLHECGHWSGSEKRLNWDLKNRFGTKAYAAEELIAELTAAFLCAHLGVEGELRHAGYIADWIRLLKEDDRAIFTAASKASQAADFLRAFSQGEDHAEAA